MDKGVCGTGGHCSCRGAEEGLQESTGAMQHKRVVSGGEGKGQVAKETDGGDGKSD